MIAQAAPRSPSNPWTVHLARIARIRPETPGVSTYDLVFDDPPLANSFRFQCGQFNMLYLPGVGEAAISLSSDPATQGEFGHTGRSVAAGRLKIAAAAMLSLPPGASAWRPCGR
jgi:NAD(P)H-flavin reductase